jgi:hypothetical protein
VSLRQAQVRDVSWLRELLRRAWHLGCGQLLTSTLVAFYAPQWTDLAVMQQ